MDTDISHETEKRLARIEEHLGLTKEEEPAEESTEDE
jgi:hypothetical protein